MPESMGSKVVNKKIVECLITELRRGLELLAGLDAELYAKPIDGSSVGAHFRHNFDFASAIIDGFRTGRIDYCDRERDTRIEKDAKHAVRVFESLISDLENLEFGNDEPEILIRSEVHEQAWLPSSASRELEFVHSHTVHHYALIAAKLSRVGVDVAPEFGVAPSTLRFWRSLKSDTKAA